MEKKFNKFELARLKRTAQNVEQFVARKNRLVAQMSKLQAELDSVNQMIEVTDAATVAMTGGYHSEDIIRKVVTPTDKLDKNGNILKQTTYEFIYPDTIVPPVMEVPCTEGICGSDFDVDSETIGVEPATDETDFNLEAE